MHSFVVLLGLLSCACFVNADRWKRELRPVTCLDRFAAIPGHTMCLATINKRPVSAADRQLIVDKHNDIRRKVNPPAADMLEMQYFISLELEAQIWAEQCKFDHDDTYKRFQPGRFMVGQNIAIHSKPMTWTEVLDLWKSEDTKFNYGVKGNNYLTVGHYTELVWAKTALVGCGMAKCDNRYLYVCNYGPSGNVGSIDTPYSRSMTGNSCDACPGHCNTTSKLCDCNGKFCLNGATLNLTTCECHCNNAVNYYDTDICELVCEDDVDNKLCGNAPWNKASCLSNMAAIFNCPKLCGICPYAGANYTEGSVPLPSGNSASHSAIYLPVLIMTSLVYLRRHI